ncbi:MAG: Flagellar biosynthesis protein FliS [Labilithrix sp.]|nr:Flagellar biosynthesis protein FliS [Labilithrix sp.]
MTFNASAVAARYKGVQVQTCSPVQLLVMLYDGALRFVAEAQAAMVAKDRARAGDRIGRAHAIVTELTATLDHEQAPELCENLLALYSFCTRRLLEANLAQDPKILADVVIALTPIREGFAAIRG